MREGRTILLGDMWRMAACRRWGRSRWWNNLPGSPFSRRGLAEKFHDQVDANGRALRKKRRATNHEHIAGAAVRDGDPAGHAGFSERRIEPGGKSAALRGGDRGDTLESAGAEGSRHQKCNWNTDTHDRKKAKAARWDRLAKATRESERRTLGTNGGDPWHRGRVTRETFGSQGGLPCLRLARVVYPHPLCPLKPPPNPGGANRRSPSYWPGIRRRRQRNKQCEDSRLGKS